MEKETSNEIKREELFQTLLEQIRQAMRIRIAALQSLPDSEAAQLQTLAEVRLVNEILPIYAIASAIHKHGLPRSLIFINEDGMAIDLLKIEELNQESAFDELLDNMKGSK